MQIRYIGHASMAVDIAGKRVLCDPWWNGPAYTGQWWHYPPPSVDAADARDCDFLYISHGHEDHLHPPTLADISKRAAVVIPRFRHPGMRDSLHALGFSRVIEIGHGERKRLAPGLHASIYINKEDSILVLEGDGRTLVDANDALHASSRHVIDHLCDQIRSRHPVIHTLLLGYGGASWFPNCIRVTDGEEYDAIAREQVFAENFAYVARRLGAQMALPFAASFVLLEEDLRWINEVKLRSGSPCDQLRQQGASEIRSHFLMPGDRVLDDRIIGSTGARPDVEGTLADIERRFAAQFLERRRPRPPDASRWDEILAALRSNAASRAPRILKSNQHLLCRIDLRDVPELSLLVDCTPERAHIDRCDRLRLAPMVLTTRFEILEALARQDYGFESISIGYGATLQLRRRDLGLRGPLLAVLGRKPLPPNRMQRLQAWLRSPWRAFAVWRRDLHWQHLALQMRRGRIQRTNDIYAAEPERWSPLRESPLPAARRA